MSLTAPAPASVTRRALTSDDQKLGCIRAPRKQAERWLPVLTCLPEKWVSPAVNTAGSSSMSPRSVALALVYCVALCPVRTPMGVTGDSVCCRFLTGSEMHSEPAQCFSLGFLLSQQVTHTLGRFFWLCLPRTLPQPVSHRRPSLCFPGGCP